MSHYTSLYDEFCEHMELEGMYGATYNLTAHKIFDGPLNALEVIWFLSIITLICSFFVILAAWYNPKLTMHPYGLITLITIVDASYIMTFNIFGQLCNWHLPYVFTQTITIPYATDMNITIDESFIEKAMYDNLVFLHECGEVGFAILLLLSLMLNICLCLDLYYTVKNPFSKASSKTISVTVVFIILIMAGLIYFLLRITAF